MGSHTAPVMPSQSLYVGGFIGGLSSHPLSPASLPPCLWHHPTLSIHLPCLSFPISKVRPRWLVWGVGVVKGHFIPFFEMRVPTSLVVQGV